MLDEATSALDSETEEHVIDSIDNLTKQITIVMIAHRLSTLSRCNRVVKLEQGVVVACGPPDLVCRSSSIVIVDILCFA